MQFGGNNKTNGHKLQPRVHAIWSSYDIDNRDVTSIVYGYECYYPLIVWTVFVNYTLDWTRLFIHVKDVCMA